jgi:hypothetical protein
MAVSVLGFGRPGGKIEPPQAFLAGYRTGWARATGTWSHWRRIGLSQASPAPGAALKRDEIGMNRHRALGCCLSMIFSENRCALFRIML